MFMVRRVQMYKSTTVTIVLIFPNISTMLQDILKKFMVIAYNFGNLTIKIVHV